jgi:predicted HTH transcriptional regulator
MSNPIVHSGDPQSSVIAAEQVTQSGWRASLKARVLETIVEHPGHTAGEIAHILDLPSVDIRRRITDLKHDGVIWPGEMRLCEQERTQQSTYFASRVARQASMFGGGF